MKRKHSEDVYDDSSFAPLFPKSRRLDADLLSSRGEEVPTTSFPAFEQKREHLSSPSLILSEDEKAIVLYNPINNRSTFPFLKSPSSPEFSVIVKSNLIPALKDYLYGSENSRPLVSAEEQAAGDESNRDSNDCLAVVPWVAPHHHLTCGPEELEAQNMEIDMMDMEDNEAMAQGTERSQQWQQQLQHSMAPQLHQNMSTTITWW